MNDKVKRYQKTFDDLEPVLEPEQRERIIEPWNNKLDCLPTALQTYDRIKERRIIRAMLDDELF